MKKSILLLILLLFFSSIHINSFAAEPSTELRTLDAASIDNTNINNSFRGHKNGKSLVQNINFRDIGSHEYKNDIIKLSALSIVRGYEDSRFYPNRSITKEETLILIVKALGLEGEVLEQVYTNNAGYGSTYREIRGEFINQAITLGIVDEEESYNLGGEISREQALSWIGKAIDIAPIYNDIQLLRGHKDLNKIAPSNIGIIEALLQEGIYDYGKVRTLNLKGSINRGEMAHLLSEMLPSLYENNDGAAMEGLIVDKENNNQNTKFVIIDKEGALSTIEVTKNSLSNEDIVVYLNGNIIKASDLKIGYSIEYIVKDNEVIYIEVKNDKDVLTELENNIMGNDSYSTHHGTIVLKSKENLWQNDRLSFIEEIYIRNNGGELFKLVIEQENQYEINNDIIVYKGNNFGGKNLLQEGDEIKYIVKDNENILFIEVKDLF